MSKQEKKVSSIDEQLASFSKEFEQELAESMEVEMQPSEKLLAETKMKMLQFERLQAYDQKQEVQKQTIEEKNPEVIIPVILFLLGLIAATIAYVTFAMIPIEWVGKLVGGLLSLSALQIISLSLIIHNRQRKTKWKGRAS